MSTVLRIGQSIDTMSQIVPSAGFTPPYCDYTAFTTDFDLSLLPSSPDSEVPYSPTALSSFLSFYSSAPFDDGIVCDSFGFVNDLKCSKTELSKMEEDEPLNTPMKKSTFFDGHKMDKKEFEETLKFVKKENEETPLIPTTVHGSSFSYPSVSVKEEPMSYMMGCEYADVTSPQMNPRVLPLSSPCSPATSYSSQSSYHKSLPPSPYAKTEKSVDLQEIMKESRYLETTVRAEASTSQNFPTLQNLLRKEEKTDHQLLRSVLRDTSFQKKFNLKPFQLECGEEKKTECYEDEKKSEERGSEIGEELTREKIEPVLSLAIEQLRQEVDNTCTALGISSDPTQWSKPDVKSWLLWTVRQLSLPMISLDYFDVDGQELLQLTEEEFQQRNPQSGSILHAQLEIWKAASSGEYSEHNVEYNKPQWSPPMQSSGSSTGEISEEEDEEMEQVQVQPSTSQQTTEQTAPATTNTVPKTRGSGGSHIHLWQFLKELLSSPQVHGSCIRWLDRQKGVFKIEDSVRVARLWGKRKNRPAMNYDKLSRSIRQYYKKGIMKKTERSQRLVYQFCHPYSL